jgi:NAD(P)-dependent dehydrogenase (short-subunit alcohol dehydrogenase family)
VAALAQAPGQFGRLDVLFCNAGIAGYATAKHAQVGLMRTAAKEAVTRGIRVNSVHPGATGTALPVDGGMRI